MEKVWMENKSAWLFDLAYGELDDDAVVKGFLKHYVLQGKGLDDIKRELHFHTVYGDHYIENTMHVLKAALWQQIDAPPRSEMRTLDEVDMIIQSIRAGLQVQVDYYDPEIDDDPFVCRAVW